MLSEASQRQLRHALFVRENQLATQRIRRLTADRCVEQLNRVHDRRFHLPSRQRRLKLQNAPRISRGYDISIKRSDVLRFAVAEFHRGIWLNEIVDSRRTSADRSFRNFSKLELRNSRKQSARLRAHPLRVL